MLSTAGEAPAETLARCGKVSSELTNITRLDNPQVSACRVLRKYGTRHASTVPHTYTGFDHPQIEFSSEAICVNGTWPLLHSAQAANALSPLGSSHTHELSTVTYFMPDGFHGAQHSDVTCPPETTTLPPMTHALGGSELVPLPGVRDASLLQGDLACKSQLQSATHLFLRDSSNVRTLYATRGGCSPYSSPTLAL